MKHIQCCVGPSRQVFTFGCNDDEALGRESSDDEDDLCFHPLFVDLGRIEIAQVSAGDSHTAALSCAGRVYVWGAFRVRVAELSIDWVKIFRLLLGGQPHKRRKISTPIWFRSWVLIVAYLLGQRGQFPPGLAGDRCKTALPEICYA